MIGAMTAPQRFSRLAFLRGAWLAAVVLCACAFAASQQPAPSVHDLAQRVDRHYNQLHSLKSQFTESYEGLGVKRSESGALLLVKPGKMRWDYSQPAGKIFLLDGKYAWFYRRGDAQVQRIEAKKLDDLRSPLRFLLGRTELEKELTNLTLAAAPDGRFTLSGQPRGPHGEPDQRVPKLALTVTAEGAITAIEMDEADGATTRFTFTGEEPNAAVPESAFHFAPPAGVPVVDGLPPV
jgi:outer membrane lipoprotein carrier protein